MTLYREEGVVVRTLRLGEADRIVTLVTPEHGKVRAVAKGVRKTRSKIGARLEPLSHVSLLCWHGRELDVVTQVEVIDSFRPIREDLDRLAGAMTLLEVVDQLALERHPMPELFTMLVKALRTLERDASPLLVGAFCWKVLAIEGLEPVVEVCARCGEDVALVAFDVAEGGFLCRGCRRGQAVSAETVDLVRRVLGGGLAGVLAEPAGPAGSEMERLGTSAIEHHLDRRLRSTRHLLELGATGR